MVNDGKFAQLLAPISEFIRGTLEAARIWRISQSTTAGYANLIIQQLWDLLVAGPLNRDLAMTLWLVSGSLTPTDFV